MQCLQCLFDRNHICHVFNGLKTALAEKVSRSVWEMYLIEIEMIGPKTTERSIDRSKDLFSAQFGWSTSCAHFPASTRYFGSQIEIVTFTALLDPITNPSLRRTLEF